MAYKKFVLNQSFLELENTYDKFGVISPVLHEPGIGHNKYFMKLSKQGLEIPPGSDNIYYLHVSTYKVWLKKYNESGLDGLKEKTRSDMSGDSTRIRPCLPGPLKKRLLFTGYPKYYIVTREKCS